MKLLSCNLVMGERVMNLVHFWRYWRLKSHKMALAVFLMIGVTLTILKGSSANSYGPSENNFDGSFLMINHNGNTPKLAFVSKPMTIANCQNTQGCVLVPLRSKSERRKRHAMRWELIDPKIRLGRKKGRKKKNTTSSLGRLKVFKYVTEDSVLNSGDKSPILVGANKLVPPFKHGGRSNNNASGGDDYKGTSNGTVISQTERPRRSPFPKAEALIGPNNFNVQHTLVIKPKNRFNPFRKVIVPTHYVGTKPIFITQPPIKVHQPVKLLPKSKNKQLFRRNNRMPIGNKNLKIMKPPDAQKMSPSVIHYHHEPPPSAGWMDVSLEKEATTGHPFFKRWNQKIRSQMARLRNRRRKGHVPARSKNYLTTPTKEDYDRIRQRRKPSYNYPRNAHNIQDILTHFEEKPQDRKNRRPHTSVYKGSGLGDFSQELRDVEGSLLKDIREFSHRPQIWDEESPPRGSTHVRQSYTTTEDPYDTIFDPKPKPVRDMIKSPSKFSHYDDPPSDYKNNKYFDDNDHPPYHHKRHRHRDQYYENDHHYDDRNKEHGYHSSEEDTPHHYHRNQIRPPNYKHSRYEPEHSREYHHSKESHYSPYPRKKPIVLKHPYSQQSYNSKEWGRVPHDDERYWKHKYKEFPISTEVGDSHKRPSVNLPHPHNQFVTEYTKLDGPVVVPTEAAKKEMERKALEKLYMDLLKQKAIAEAALLKPSGSAEKPEATTTTVRSVKKKPPMRMKIHIYPNEEDSEKEDHHHNGRYNNHNRHSDRDTEHSYSHHYHQPNHHSVNHRLGGFSTGHRQESFRKPGISVEEREKGNKNFVLHLHVHRRNGGGGAPFELETDASQVAPSTVSPAYTYRDIFEQEDEEKEQTDQTVSMEVPIRDDKIEDVLHTLLRLREGKRKKRADEVVNDNNKNDNSSNSKASSESE